MTHHRSLVATIAFLGASMSLPCVASAQRMTSRTGGTAARATAPPRTMARPVPASGVRVNVGRTVANRSLPATNQTAARHRAGAAFNGGLAGAPLSFQDLLNITPNSGFNWEHVNAINRDLPEKALIDPVTQLEIAQAERLLRTTGGTAFGGGAYILGGYPYYMSSESNGEEAVANEAAQAPQSAPQPQIIVLQQPPAQQAASAAATPPAVEPPIPDRGVLTLVLRSGEQVKALAFSHINGKIVYITPDGGRSSIEAADLDPAATVRVNEKNGTPLQLPL